jgi:Ca2+:H+ antiporter
VVRRANLALHSSPSSAPELFLNPGNLLWLVLFGWWLACVVSVISLVMRLVPCGGKNYSTVLFELALYLLWPFGRYVERQVEISPTQIGGALEQEQDEDEEVGLLTKAPKPKQKSWIQSVIDTIRLGPAACIYYILFYTMIGKI